MRNSGIGTGVAVDDLVVVADAEAVVARGGQEPDEQEVGRGQVLELVDEQVPAARPGPRRRASGSVRRISMAR